MTPFPYTEDTLVQQTTADCLEWLGWESVYAHLPSSSSPSRAPDSVTAGSPETENQSPSSSLPVSS